MGQMGGMLFLIFSVSSEEGKKREMEMEDCFAPPHPPIPVTPRPRCDNKNNDEGIDICRKRFTATEMLRKPMVGTQNPRAE
jgi:hypothetical protein